MTTENESSSIIDVNRQLDSLAKKCSDPSQHVILLASQCEDLYRSTPNVDIVSFNTLLKAFAKTCATLAETHAGGIGALQHQNVDTTEVPSIPVYTARDAAERATNLLLEMERKHEEDPESPIEPDITSYNCVIDAWAKSRVDDAPQACERLLKRMIDHPTIQPDFISYNSVIDAWHYVPDGLERIEKIYAYMKKENENGNTRVKPTIRTSNTMIAAYVKRASRERGHDALQYAKRAHDLLEEAKLEYEETQDARVEPNVMTYTSVMDAYSKCGTLEATLAAESLLEELKENEKLEPNTRTYTALITAWSRTKSYKSPHNCEALLQEMESSETAKPNTRSYTAAIQAWARSRDATKPQRALRMLKKMKEHAKNGDQNVKPNLVTYNGAIDACARCQGTQQQQTEALKIAFAILKSIELEPDQEPSHVTFGTLLKATSFLLPPGDERNKVATALFEKAKSAGQVDVNILKNIRKAVDNNVMVALLQDLQDARGRVDYNKIPPEWSRNVR